MSRQSHPKHKLWKMNALKRQLEELGIPVPVELVAAIEEERKRHEAIRSQPPS